jgi:hypothetical protein
MPPVSLQATTSAAAALTRSTAFPMATPSPALATCKGAGGQYQSPEMVMPSEIGCKKCRSRGLGRGIGEGHGVATGVRGLDGVQRRAGGDGAGGGGGSHIIFFVGGHQPEVADGHEGKMSGA